MHTSTGRPPLKALLGLGLLVLAAHLWLLAGGLPGLRVDVRPEDSAHGPQSTSGQSATPDDSTPAAERTIRPASVQVSAVRWLSPPQSLPEPSVRPVQPSRPPPPPRRTRAEQAPVQPPVEHAPRPQEDIARSDAPQAPSEVPVQEDPSPAEPGLPSMPAPPGTEATDEALAIAQAPVPTEGSELARSAAPPAPADPPPSMTLDYDIQGKAKGLSYSADAQLQWRNEGPNYSARLSISAFLLGSRVQVSEGRMGPDGLQPERFGDRRRGTEKAAHFDPAGQRIRFSSNAPDAPLLPGAQDRLSVFLQLGALLQARPDAFATGSTIELQVAGTGQADVWRFEVGEVETLDLPIGRIDGLRLVRAPRHEHDSTVEIWLARHQSHVPARIRITEPDGTQADQRLRRFTMLVPTPS